MAGWEEEIHKMMKNKIMGEGMTPESRFRCPRHPDSPARGRMTSLDYSTCHTASAPDMADAATYFISGEKAIRSKFVPG